MAIIWHQSVSHSFAVHVHERNRLTCNTQRVLLEWAIPALHCILASRNWLNKRGLQIRRKANKQEQKWRGREQKERKSEGERKKEKKRQRLVKRQ